MDDVEPETPYECAMPCTYNSRTATSTSTDSFVYNNGVKDFVVVTYNDLGNGWRCYPLHGINGRLDHYVNWEGSSGYKELGQSHQKLRFVIGLCYIFCVFFDSAGARLLRLGYTPVAPWPALALSLGRFFKSKQGSPGRRGHGGSTTQRGFAH